MASHGVIGVMLTSTNLWGLSASISPVPGLPTVGPIWSVTGALPQMEGLIGRQFTADATDYDTRYFHSEAFATNYRAVVGDRDHGLPIRTVLDVACGSGNSTIALCQEYPNASITATDLSLELLLILDRRLAEGGLRDRVQLLWADSSKLPLAEGAFDIVVGSSMLHHMEVPRNVGLRMIRASAPGRLCVVFEPFLAGHLVLLQAIRGLLAMSDVHGGIEDGVRRALATYALTIEVLGNSSTDPAFRAQLDDKWLFSRGFFGALARDAGAIHWVARTNPDGEQLAEKLAGIVYAATGTTASWPEWATAYLRTIDGLRAGELEDETLFEGGVGFVRL